MASPEKERISNEIAPNAGRRKLWITENLLQTAFVGGLIVLLLGTWVLAKTGMVH